MYEFDVYLTDLKPADPANPDKAEWIYYLPDSLLNKLSHHENWMIKCDFISLSSNISTTDECSLRVLNSDQPEIEFTYHFEPTTETSITDFQELISAVLAMDEIAKVCGGKEKIWSFTFDQELARFKLGKSNTLPPVELRDKLHLFMNKELGQKLGFKSNNGEIQFDYANLAKPNPTPYYGDVFPDVLKYFRRFYLVGDFVQPSILNDLQYGIITSFNNPYYFNPSKGRGTYGFYDSKEIDRSQNNNWIGLFQSRLWRIRLTNELMKTLTTVNEHDIHFKFRLKPAPIF